MISFSFQYNFNNVQKSVGSVMGACERAKKTKKEVDELEQFYKFPKHWLTDEPFCKMDIRSLAILMIANDLVDWSLKNGWIENGSVYIQLSNKTIHEKLNIANATIVSCKKKLQDAGLIFIPKNGKGRADKWFLDPKKLNVSSSISEPNQFNFDKNQFKNDTSQVVQFLDGGSSISEPNQFNFDKKVVQKLNTNKTNIKTNNKTNISRLAAMPPELSQLINEVLGMNIKPFDIQDIYEELSETNADLLVKAFEVAKSRGGRSWAYVRTILNDWKAQGFTKPEDVELSKAKYSKSSKPSNYYGIEGSGY